MKLFDSFRLDTENRCLWRADARVPLSPKAFSVLRHLVCRAGRVVSQNEFLDSVWKDLDVQPEILKKNILEIRKALGDRMRDPIYIETLPRLGYRFIAPVRDASDALKGDSPHATRQAIVGRDREREVLHAALAQAAAGRGSMLCLTGEPGAGKTALAEEFLFEASARGSALIVRGRCSEHLAATGTYLPIMEALDTVATGGAGESSARAMRALAPGWHAQLAPDGASAAPCPQRLARELAALLQQCARERPLVLLLDDLQWADARTVDLLAYIAPKLARWRVLIVATCSLAELERVRHPFGPLKLELQSRGVCHELPLRLLTPAETERCIAHEFAGHRFPSHFARLIHTRSSGNPLFMVSLLRHLRERGCIAQAGGSWELVRELPDIERDLPEALRSSVQRKLEQLEDSDRRLLCAAAMQGRDFDSTVLARMLELDASGVEERLVALERLHEVVRVVSETELPHGTPSLHCRFVHTVHQQALLASLTPSQRAWLSTLLAQAHSAHRLHGFGENVTHALLGADQRLAPGLGLQLAAQPTYLHVDRPVVHLAFGQAGESRQLVARQHALGHGQKDDQQVEQPRKAIHTDPCQDVARRFARTVAS